MNYKQKNQSKFMNVKVRLTNAHDRLLKNFPVTDYQTRLYGSGDETLHAYRCLRLLVRSMLLPPMRPPKGRYDGRGGGDRIGIVSIVFVVAAREEKCC